MPTTYPVFTQTSNKILRDLQSINTFSSVLNDVLGGDPSADGISAADVAQYLQQVGAISTSIPTLSARLDGHDTDIANKASTSDLTNAVSGLASSDDIAHLASSNAPVPLGTVPVPPAGFLPAPPTQGYIPVSDQSGKQAAQLISLYAEGIDGKVDADLVTAPLDNGTLSVIDIILSSTATDVPTVDINNVSNLMTVSSVRDASVFGTFKVLSQSGPGPVIVGTYDTAANTDSIYYQITAEQEYEQDGAEIQAAEAGSVRETNNLDTSKEYDFELRTLENTRKLYLREHGTEDYSKVLTDNSSGDTYNAAPFGFFANSNVVLRNLRSDSHLYSQIQSFNAVATSVNPIVDISAGVTAIAMRTYLADAFAIDLFQVPNNGLWNSAPADLNVRVNWDAFGGFPQNVYTVFNYTDNEYPGVNKSDYLKFIALRGGTGGDAIPTSVTDALNDNISPGVADYPALKAIVENTISGIQSGNVVYFEQAQDPTFFTQDATIATLLNMFLINVTSGEIIRLKVSLSNTYDFAALANYGETNSVIESNFDTADEIQLDSVSRGGIYGDDRIAKIGTGTGEIANFSDFDTVPASGLA